MTKTLMNTIGSYLVITGTLLGIAGGVGSYSHVGKDLKYNSKKEVNSPVGEYISLGLWGMANISGGIFLKNYSDLRKEKQKL
jgi:hypothetical protein